MCIGFPGITCLAFSSNYSEVKLLDLGIAMSAGKNYLTIPDVENNCNLFYCIKESLI